MSSMDFTPPDLECRFGCGPAIAVFAMDRGCVCYPDDRQQALCMQHIVRATPLGRMTVVRDLTADAEFTKWWGRR